MKPRILPSFVLFFVFFSSVCFSAETEFSDEVVVTADGFDVEQKTAEEAALHGCHAALKLEELTCDRIGGNFSSTRCAVKLCELVQEELWNCTAEAMATCE